MSTSGLFGEQHIQQRLAAALEIYADAIVPGVSNNELWRSHQLHVIPDNRAGGFTVSVFANSAPGVELARFAVNVVVRKLAHVSETREATPLTTQPLAVSDYTIGGRHLVDVELPAKDIVAPEWIEGAWGPTKTSAGLNYALTPVAGDIFRGPDGGEWKITKALNPSNPDQVSMESIPDGRVFASKPPQGWATPVTFRRGKHGVAVELLATQLGATLIETKAVR